MFCAPPHITAAAIATTDYRHCDHIQTNTTTTTTNRNHQAGEPERARECFERADALQREQREHLLQQQQPQQQQQQQQQQLGQAGGGRGRRSSPSQQVLLQQQQQRAAAAARGAPATPSDDAGTGAECHLLEHAGRFAEAGSG